MTIILIGYRGCGKSTVSLLLAQKLNLPVFSLDKEIEKSAGQTIPEIVATHGWDYFRDLETKILKLFIAKAAIIDCGGGIIEREENRLMLKASPNVFFLKADVQELHKRLSDKTDRPSLTGNMDFLSEIKEVYERRLPLYENSARFMINANQNSPQIAQDILQIIKPHSA